MKSTDESLMQSGKSRRDKVLSQEINTWDDPSCFCEAEPRWLVFQEGDQGPLGEWEGIGRAPSDEL